MALSAKQQAGWMFTFGNAIFAISSCGATYLAIEPKAGPLVAIIGGAFVLMVAGAGRAAGAFLAENKWGMGILFFSILGLATLANYKTDDMGLKEVAQGAEDKRLAGNAEIEAAREALEAAILRKNELETFLGKAKSSDPETVKEAQLDLKDFGFYEGKIDGQRGGKTDEAMKQWSEVNNIAVELVRLNAKIEEKRDIGAGKIDNEASFLTLEMAGMLAYVISGGSLICSFLGGFLCSSHKKESELELLQLEREALEKEREEKAERESEEAKAAAEIQDAMNKRLAEIKERLGIAS